MLSFNLSSVTRLEKYNPNNNLGDTKPVFACDKTDKNAYLIMFGKDGKSTDCLIFSPNDKVKEAIVKFVPKYISNSAFK